MTHFATRRRTGWLAAGLMAGTAMLAPATVLAAGPGGDDHLPNSGHTSNTGGVVPAMLANATLSCDAANSVLGLDGHLTLGGTAGAGTSVVVYLTPNNGSDASPAGNVENNEATIDISAKTGDVAFVLHVTSAFTATKGGVLAVFAMDQDGTVFTSKSNSLNCGESLPLATPTPAPTATSTPAPTGTPTDAPTPTPTAAPTTTPSTAPTATPAPTSTATPAPTGTPAPRGGGTPTPTPGGDQTPTPVPTTAIVSTPVPQITPPPTDTSRSTVATGPGSWLLLLILGAISLATVALMPATRRSRR